MIILLLVSVSLYWRWFFTPAIFTWGDWGFYLPLTARQFFTLPFIWNDAFLGFVDIGLSLYPVSKLFYGLLSFAFSSTIVDRIIFFFPSIIGSVIGSYLLLKYVSRSRSGAIVGGLLYSFNTYFLLIRTGHLTLATAFALAPLGLLLFIKSLDRSDCRLAVYCGLTSVISSFYEVRAFYLIAWIYFLYAIYYVFTHRFTIRSFLYLAVVGLITALLNFYWLFALSGSGGVLNSSLFTRPLFGTREMNILKAITLFHSPDPQLAIPIYYWLLPTAAFVGLYLGRKNRFLSFFALIALIGIFFTKLTGEPFGFLYPWLYAHLPGFNLFRESSKFFFLVALGYSALIAQLVASFSKHWTIKLLTIAAICVIMSPFPSVIQGTLGKLMTPRSVPSSYVAINNFIASQPGYFRTLYLPQDSRWAAWTHLHPKLSTRSLVNQEWYLLNNYTSTGLDYSEFAKVTGILTKPFSDSLLDAAAVKYIVVPPADDANEDNFYQEYTRSQFIELLDTLPFLTKIPSFIPDMTLYENEGYSSLFSVPSTFINPTRYDISPAKTSFTFSQMYHPGWVATDAQGIDYPSTPDSFGLTVFQLPPTVTSVTVHFQPQRKLYVGLAISLASAAVILLGLRYARH